MCVQDFGGFGSVDCVDVCLLCDLLTDSDND